MKRLAFACGAATLFAALLFAQEIDRETLWRDLDVLAADNMEGRLPGTAGHERARQYIERRFREAGLEPAKTAYSQRFTFRSRMAPGSAEQTGTNIVGMLRGTSGSGLAIVVTAHYDHLGTQDGRVFNGADDNASGTAALFALATMFKASPPQHTMVFAALDAEETGLNGARAFLEDPPVPTDRIVLNVNLDMIGRDEKNTLYVAGTSHYPFLKPYVARAAGKAPVKLVPGHDGPGAPFIPDWTRDSDHYLFHLRGIPFLYFGVEDLAHHHKASDKSASMTRAFYAGAVESIAAVVRGIDADARAIVRKRIAPRPARQADAVRTFIKSSDRVIALTNARVIDGTGAPARENQTIVIRDAVIAYAGESARATIPEGATVIDLTGKSVIPGLVMVHEHLYYPTGGSVYAQLGASFVRLYLAGGVTTMRTGGNVHGFMDMKMKQLVDEGQQAGPAIDATAPYLNGPNGFLQMRALDGAADASRQVDYWADMGATSFKAYMNITRAELKGAIEQAHARGLKITGHLCSVTYAEAADLGIDNLEHGFLASTDFVSDKKPDDCPGQGRGQQAIAALDENGAPFKALVAKLVEKRVAVTSTLTVFETFTPGRPIPPGLDVLLPQLKEQFERTHARIAQNQQSAYLTLFPKAMATERAFARAGGLLLAGTDPTGSGGVVPGYSNHRQLELLVEAGFTPLEAIRIGTLNGATYLGRDARIGTIAAGKQADLVVIDGDPSRNIADVRRVDTVFKQGIAYDPVKLRESVAGKVGLY